MRPTRLLVAVLGVLPLAGCVSSASPLVQSIDAQLREPATDGEVRTVDVGRGAPSEATEVLIVCRGATTKEIQDTVGFPVPISDPAPTDPSFLAAIVILSETEVLEVAQLGQGAIGVDDSEWLFNPCPPDLAPPHFVELGVDSATVDFEFFAEPSHWVATGGLR